MTYECTGVVGPDGFDYSSLCDGFDGVFNGQSSDGLLTNSLNVDQYTSGEIPSGIHTFTITATSEGGIQKSADFKWYFIDPCAPPNLIRIDEIQSPDLPYVVTDDLPEPI